MAWTPLIHAACNGQLPLVSYLVQRGAEINAADNVRTGCVTNALIKLNAYQKESSSLMHAAENGHLSVVEYLVERGANLNSCNNVKLRATTAMPRLNILSILSGRFQCAEVCSPQ